MSKPVLRGGTWYLRRRVPKRYKTVEPRREIWESLKTDSYRVAMQKSEGVWLAYIEAWEAKLAGRDGDAVQKFRAAQQLADIRGFQFLAIDQISLQPLDDILNRVEATRGADGIPDEITAAALLGTVEEPKLLLSDLLAHVEDLAAHDNRFKNDEQMRVWRSSRKRAVNNLIQAIGKDLPVVAVGTAEARAHKKFLSQRVLNGSIQIETANKDFNYLSGMLSRFYDDLDHENQPKPYAGLAFSDRNTEPTQKLEVSVNWILEKWFAPGALDCLNDEARDILLISIETGSRQNEIFNLPASAIRLDDPIPHLLVANQMSENRSDRREIKNMPSRRQIPLVGVALAAARRHPNGFPRYRNSSAYSNGVNKTLRNNNLLPKGITIGGVRHSWESRMKKAGYANDDRGELMGHSRKRTRGREAYGDIMSLEERLAIAQEISLPAPDHLL